MDSKTKKVVNGVFLVVTGLLALLVIFYVGRKVSSSGPESMPGPAVEPPATVAVAPVETTKPAVENGGGPAIVDVQPVPTPPVKAPPVAPAAALKDVVVYTNDLDTEPGEEWSDKTISEAPSDHRKYLGDFKTEQVSLSLENLPPHKMLKIKFDLLTMRSWDGSNKSYHETFWDMSVSKGPNLIHTTFGNCGFFSDNNEQAFPDSWPCGPHPAWTGSAEHQTLGVFQDWGGPARTFDCSSVYRLVLEFPHEDGKVTFRFKGTPTGSLNKPWGLAHVEVTAIAALKTATAEQMDAMWTALASADPMEAYRAHWDFVALGDAATGYLAKRLKEEPGAAVGPPKEDFSIAIQDLMSADDGVVDAAIARLTGKNTPEVRNGVLGTYANPDVRPATRTKLRPLVTQLAGVNANAEESLTDLRMHRARHLLQVIHSDQAMEIVDTIKVHDGDDGLYLPPTGKKLP